MTRRSLRLHRSCSTRAHRARFDSLEAISADYLAKHSDNADRELQFYRGQRSFEDALENAALARLPLGKRAHHQRRLSSSTLTAAWNALRKRDFSQCNDFHDVFSLVNETVRPIHGIGELYVYDTALRIGAYLQFSPDRVYLHAGVRDGARALGFSGGEYILCSDLPNGFNVLEPHQIEDCLCIYKGELADLNGI